MPIETKQIKKLAGILCLMSFCLIALGGTVRTMNAGLSCPDWPLCFGKYIPDYDPKVYFEFIHRVLAGLVSIVTLVLGILIFRSSQISKSLKRLMLFTWVLLITQVIMGGLTVLKLLNFGIVTTHLALGSAFFGTMIWIYMRLADSKEKVDVPKGFRILAMAITAIVYCQILLGGMVSSNYAGLACPDFPLCFGEWIPTLSGPRGIQVIHRFGAYTTFLSIYVMFFAFKLKDKKSWSNRSLLQTTRVMTSLVLMQLVLGMSNIIFKMPPIISILHLAVAVSLLGMALRVVYLSFYEPAKR